MSIGPSPASPSDRAALRVGFMPLIDAAPLIVAHELGFAAAAGFALALVRETSWANIRDRIVLGHLDAAQMLAPMVIATRLGIGHVQAPLIAPYVLSRGGNAIAVTPALFAEDADWGAPGDPLASGRALARIVRARAARGAAPLTLAAVYPFSGHHYQLCDWIAAAGLDPARDVQMTVVPPPYMVEAMAAGDADVICVGAPWVARAVAAGVGRCLLPSSKLWPGSPEKVLGVREDFGARQAIGLADLLPVLDRAAHWCQAPENRADLARILAQPAYIGGDAAALAEALAGHLPLTAPGDALRVEDFIRFHGATATGPLNRPRVADGLWFAAHLLRFGQWHDRRSAFDAGRAAFAGDACPALWGNAPTRDDLPVRSFAGPALDGAAPERWLEAHAAL